MHPRMPEERRCLCPNQRSEPPLLDHAFELQREGAPADHIPAGVVVVNPGGD